MSKIKLYHFHNGKSGGVHAVISNLIKFSANPLIENHVIYTINKDPGSATTITKIEGAISEQVYYYSASWNFYYTCRQLAKLLPGDTAMIAAHDWIELGMMSNLGLQNPVVFFVHGDYEYYYQLAQKHEKAIDLFIPVAKNIELQLKNVLSHRTNDICYLRFPVPAIPYAKKETAGNIIFIGRLEAAKGYSLLPAIAKKIKEKYNNLHWHIVGAAEDPFNHAKWDENIPVKFYGNIPNKEVLNLLTGMQILILPSLNEGMPVVVIEAMKTGVIPVVNDIDGGIQELVIDNESGYKIPGNEVEGYVQKIIGISENKNLAVRLQNNCIALANRLFDPIKNTVAIEDKLVEVFAAARKNKYSFKVYGSRLDQPWLANSFTHTLRKKLKR